MTRRLQILITAIAVLLPLGGNLLPAGAADYVPFVTIDAAPDGAKVAAGEHFEAAELSNTRPLSEGAVGPLPVFYADDEFGCVWTTAISSGITEWIALARRSVTTGSDHCGPFQQKVVAATLAGAEALVLINNAPGAATGTAAGTIPGAIIDQAEGTRLRESLVAGNPNAVKVTLGLLDIETHLPPPPFPVTPTKVSALNASASGQTVSVSGTASFGGVAPVTVGSDPAGDSTQPAALGYDLLQASIGQLDAATGDLVFVLDLADLPATGGLPEAARYSWDFAVRAGGTTTSLEIDGKLTDVIRRQSTSTPAFVLRGDCVAGTTLTCTDVASLATTMDGVANRITVTVPRALLEQQTKAPIAGTTIEPATICEGISAKASAYFSLCGGAGTATGDAILQDPETDLYRVASPRVDLGIVPAGAPAVYSAQATVANGGSFSANLNTSGLAAGQYDVVSRACFGSNCGTAKKTITL
jgi:hypothetical protein